MLVNLTSVGRRRGRGRLQQRGVDFRRGHRESETRGRRGCLETPLSARSDFVVEISIRLIFSLLYRQTVELMLKLG